MASIAVMNAKGGVGKSTLTMAIAETLAAFHGKSVLLIDADGQMSLSLMVMTVARLNDLRAARQTITGFLSSILPGGQQQDWRTCVAGPVGDVDDAKILYILAGDMDLTLLEREIVATGGIKKLRDACRQLLHEAKQHVDFVLVDCAPGISVVTEVWLRECDWHLIPLKPDFLAVSGMHYLKNFKQRDPTLGFAKHLGVAINMMQPRSETDQIIHDMLCDNSELRCFRAAIPMIGHIQKAALFVPDQRSFQNKYPGEAGKAIRAIAEELLDRVRVQS